MSDRRRLMSLEVAYRHVFLLWRVLGIFMRCFTGARARLCLSVEARSGDDAAGPVSRCFEFVRMLAHKRWSECYLNLPVRRRGD